MNFRLSNIPPARRWFLGVVMAVVIVVGWVVTEPLRTDVRNHYVGRMNILDDIIGSGLHLQIETNFMLWTYAGGESGNLYTWADNWQWEFSLSHHKELSAVTGEDARRARFDSISGSGKLRSSAWSSPKLLIDDGQIVIARLTSDPATVYAIQAVEQKDGRGHFRSRRILPAAGAGAGGSNASPFMPTNR